MSHAVSYYKCRNYVCIDLETTGLNIDESEIIEIGAVKVRHGEIEDCYNTLVKPYGLISSRATNVNGITEEDVKDAPHIDDVFENFLNFVGDDILLGHNIAAFDLHIIREQGRKNGRIVDNKYLDTLTLARKMLPDLPSLSLESLCNYYGIENKQAHRALGDCFATIEVYNALINNKTGDINSIKKGKKNNGIYFSKLTDGSRLLVRLTGIIEGIICDGIVNDEEFNYLYDWLMKHQELKGNYQYDYLVNSWNNLSNSCKSHQEHLISRLKSILDPVESKSEHLSFKIDFIGKNICLTGEFQNGSKSDISNKFIKMGAVIHNSVTRKVDYLIVGGNGSKAWALENYGTKVKKALELQEKGFKISILRESDIF